MSDASTTIVGLHCPQCGARQVRAGNACWLCSAKIFAKDSPHTERPCPTIAEPERFSFSLGTMMLLMTLASVTFGILAINRGVGVFVCVLLAPVLVRTMLVVQARETVGKEVRPAEKVGLFLVSFGVATVLAVVVSAVAFASFLGYVLISCSSSEIYGRPLQFYWGLGYCLVAAGVIYLIVPIAKWIRRRYRRDIDKE